MNDESQKAANNNQSANPASERNDSDENRSAEHNASPAQKEIGGRGGLDPTRYGDWEKAGRCIDF